MLLKHRDGREKDLRELKKILSGEVSEKVRETVEHELNSLESYLKESRSCDKYLDYRYQDSSNWVLIHDLHFEHHGTLAQIDHLLINRFLDLYVIDAKLYNHGLKVTEEGAFQLWDGESYQDLASPFEENVRQIQALQQCIGERDLGPRRQGFVIPIKYRNIILMAPDANLIKPDLSRAECSSVVKADSFVTTIEQNMASKAAIDASKMVSLDTLTTFGERLVRLHRLAGVDYLTLFTG